jgi:hypothetical protein
VAVPESYWRPSRAGSDVERSVKSDAGVLERQQSAISALTLFR